MNKRNFLITAASGVSLLLAGRYIIASDVAADPSEATGLSSVDNNLIDGSDWPSFAPAGSSFPSVNDVLELSKDEWRERLNAQAFQVLRKQGTERPFTSPYNKEYRDGLFVCAGCDLPLFTSAMKYDSGTGWPSFTTAIDAHMETKRDFKLIVPRTEYHCKRCNGHQGHVFTDGPAPTGQRWCNNGVALRFIPA